MLHCVVIAIFTRRPLLPAVPPRFFESPDCNYSAMDIMSIWSPRNWAGGRLPLRLESLLINGMYGTLVRSRVLLQCPVCHGGIKSLVQSAVRTLFWLFFQFLEIFGSAISPDDVQDLSHIAARGGSFQVRADSDQSGSS
jgi:hypothetical protein